MNKPRSRLLLVLLALCGASLALGAAALPFTVEEANGYWKTIPFEKELTPGISIESVLLRAGGKIRFVVLHATRSADQTDSVATVAHQFKAGLVIGPSSNLTENDATEFGYPGRDQRFMLLSDKEPMNCDLFVFVSDKTWWGVLYMCPKDTPLPAPSPFAILRKRDPVAEGVVEMAPFRAQDTPVTSFPIGLSVTSNLVSGRVDRIVVSEVPDGSTTEQVGVKVGDEILSVNHRKVSEFSAGLGKDSELGQIFLNRDPGDFVQLELRSPDAPKSRFITLAIPLPRNFIRRGGMP